MIDMKKGLVIGAFAVLAVVAVAGWSHKARESAALSSNGSGYSQPLYYDSNGQPVYNSSNAQVNTSALQPYSDSNRMGYHSATYAPGYGSGDRYVSDRYLSTAHHPIRVVRNDSYRNDLVDNGERRDYVDNRRVYEDREVRYHHGRSTKKSVAIVAGSAAGGALIGGLAGGGKGAGIGALAGGGAGFVYDRLTHNR